MNCPQVQHHLDSWVRGELDGATGGAVAAHVAACAACRAEADLARHVVNGLRALKSPAPAALIDRIRQSAPVGVAARRGTWFTPLRALAALLLVGVVVVFSRERGDLLQPMNPSVVSAPQPMIELNATTSERAPVAPAAEEATSSVSSAGATEDAYASEDGIRIPAAEVLAPASPPGRVLRSSPAVRSSAVTREGSAVLTAAPGGAAPAGAPGPQPYTVAPDVAPAAVSPVAPQPPATALPVSTFPAPARSTMPTSDESAKTFVVEEAGSPIATTTVTRRTAGTASGFSSLASMPSREPASRTTGAKLFLRSLAGDDAVGVTSFTQSQQLRSLSRDAFRDTTAASLTNPYLKR